MYAWLINMELEFWRILLLIFFCINSVNIATANNKDSNTFVTLIVIGANGDLAKRKIWPSLQEIIYHNYYYYDQNYISSSSLSIYAATRESVQENEEMFNDYFKSLPCHVAWSLSNEDCLKLNLKLLQMVQIVRLKNETDYLQLNEIIESRTKSEENTKESARIFYLSVPPFAYGTICKYIHTKIRPFLSNDTQLRIAIEKPFGSDLSSAKNLADKILNYMFDEEVFLVDHYLHKLGSQNIVNFRNANPQIFSNPAHVDRIEIVVREFLDVKGRTRYYDQYGVIRDMIQNHLTELLTLSIADLNTNLISDEEQIDFDSNSNLTFKSFDLNIAKLHILQSIYSPFIDSTILGQYLHYKEHVFNDTNTLKHDSSTPTFAAVLVKIRSPKWSHVPIVLMSGKRLGKREAFVRISLKKPLTLNMQEKSLCPYDVVFNIDTGCVTLPLEQDFNMPKGWKNNVMMTTSANCTLNELCPLLQNPFQYIHTYRSVLENLFEGKRELFVPLVNVLESWRIWSPLIEELNLRNQNSSNLLLYNEDLLSNSSFIINGSTLMMIKHSNVITDDYNEVINVESRFQEANKFASIWKQDDIDNDKRQNYYYNASNITLYTLPRTWLAHKVSKDIYQAAYQSIKYTDSFHIALPGGSSPLYMYQSLLFNYKHTFPWDKTHVWQTDERCNVPTVHSNLYQLSSHLMEYISLPYHNIHPLHFACHYLANVEYYGSFHDYNTYISLDYVLLGVGSDGHIASLFPNYTNTFQHQTYRPTIQFVTLSSENHQFEFKERISLTMTTLLKAKRISLLLTGQGKCHLFKLLQDSLSKLNDKERNNFTDDLPFIQLIKRVSSPSKVKVWVDKNICNS